MAVRDEIKEQTEKFKDMTLSQKADYIWTYYKLWILGTIAVVLIIVMTAQAIIENSKPSYISIMFLSSTAQDGGARCTVGSEFLEKQGVDTEKFKSEFDYATYLDNDYTNQQSMAGQIKLISMYQAGQVDIVCAKDVVLEGSGDVGGYSNLEEILPDGMLDELIKKGYEPYYYTEKIYDDMELPDSEGNRPYTDGETYIAGLYIDKCDKLVGEGDSFVYNEEAAQGMVLTVAFNAPNVEHAIEFIQFISEN